MQVNKIYHRNCLELMSEIASKSIDCIITSPPYWQLRDYGYQEQWGLEPTFQEYLEHLWQFMGFAHRILKDTGTMWINLGDTYSAGGRSSANKLGGKQKTIKGMESLSKLGYRHPPPGMSEKCLLLIPHRFAIGCVDRGWILRNTIVWAKRNCMPEGVIDRFSRKHEYVFLFTKQRDYYFDLNSVKSGKNPGDVSDLWDITVKPSKEGHCAAYNPDLIDKPIIAGCPEGGIILDPFCGTGTTCARAIQLGRNTIGCDGNEKFCEIAENKIKTELEKGWLIPEVKGLPVK